MHVLRALFANISVDQYWATGSTRLRPTKYDMIRADGAQKQRNRLSLSDANLLRRTHTAYANQQHMVFLSRDNDVDEVDNHDVSQ